MVDASSGGGIIRLAAFTDWEERSYQMLDETRRQFQSLPVALKPLYATRLPNEEIVLYNGLIHIQGRYLELVILYLLNYHGNYHPRYLPRYSSNVLPVPWASASS